MAKRRNLFDILGVTPADDMTTIRMAWRAKVRQLHPDRARDRAGATAQLAEVNAAFDELQGHVPSKAAKAARAAEQVRAEERALRRARNDAMAKRQRERAAEEARRLREAQALEEAKAKAAKARLKADMGTINARAAQGYARARRVVSVLQ